MKGVAIATSQCDVPDPAITSSDQVPLFRIHPLYASWWPSATSDTCAGAHIGGLCLAAQTECTRPLGATLFHTPCTIGGSYAPPTMQELLQCAALQHVQSYNRQSYNRTIVRARADRLRDLDGVSAQAPLSTPLLKPSLDGAEYSVPIFQIGAGVGEKVGVWHSPRVVGASTHFFSYSDMQLPSILAGAAPPSAAPPSAAPPSAAPPSAAPPSAAPPSVAAPVIRRDKA